MLGDRFFVLYGDSYLTCDYTAVADAFERSGKQGLMTVFRNEGNYDTSNVEFRNGNIVRYDKTQSTPETRHIDYGLGMFQAVAFGDVQDGALYDLSFRSGSAACWTTRRLPKCSDGSTTSARWKG